MLLVEPDYKNKFPPLGLLKISTYHKMRGDNVIFYKGFLKNNDIYFDRIYITTLFSFYHKKTIETILHYKKMMNGNIKKIFVGGIYASLAPEIIYNETGIYPITGLLDRPGILGNDDIIVDHLIPDYNLLKEIKYDYDLKDSFFGYATRGCPNKCPFCSVNKLEPYFKDYINLKEYINKIKEKYGEKKDLVLFDNNILASKCFEKIIDEIKDLGFIKGSKFNNRLRSVDFNQGVDARLINDKKAQLLSEICLKPLRIAFDDIKIKDIYIKAVKIVVSKGLVNLSNYILYNCNEDTPKDFYERLRLNVELNKELGIRIYSFPMRYTPTIKTDRSFIGKFWNKRQIRGVQCILNVTKGVVMPQYDFFIEAFGESADEFEKLILMPDIYILNRFDYKNNKAKDWKKKFNSLESAQKQEFLDYIGDNDSVKIKEGFDITKNQKIKSLLYHYIETDKLFTTNKGNYVKSYRIIEAI